MTAVLSGRPRAARVLQALAGLLAALLSSCGGTDVPPPGTPVFSISATNTQFASYIVTIDSITLLGTNGTYATLLAVPQTIDLARVSDIAELVEAPAVPSGTYTSATITFDYSANFVTPQYTGIYAKTDSGATPLSVSMPGNVAGVYSTAVVVTFDPAHPLVITLGESTRVHLNLDLDSFNTVNLATATVSVQPYAALSTPPLDSTNLRARGIFVYTEASSFVMNMRPFYSQSTALGAITVGVNAQTYYNVNGVTYVGADGLTAMNALQISAPIAVYGTISSLEGITPSFNASIVIAGTSLEDPLEDHLTGVVSARSGDTVTLIHAQYRVGGYPIPYVIDGVTYYYGAGSINYLESAAVTVGTSTIVSSDGFANASQSLQSISVGQAIDVGGLTGTATPTGITLDATAGQVRLLSTRAWGVFNSATANSMSLDLITLDDFPVSLFDFSGVAAPGGVVLPSAYPVNTGSIDEVNTAPGTQLGVDGFVTAFGTAPPAFTAMAITSAAATEQVLVVEWSGTTVTDPFSTLNASGIVVDLSNSAVDTWHYIYIGAQTLDLKSLPASPLITTAGADPSEILMSFGDSQLTAGISVYSSQSTYITALTTALGTSTNVPYRLVAVGQYNAASNIFVATRINVAFHETAPTT
jgi:hypothetical protein